MVAAMSTGLRASASDLAEDFDEDLGVCSYHLKELFKGGAVILVEKRPRRGAMENIYVLRASVWEDLQRFIDTFGLGAYVAERK